MLADVAEGFDVGDAAEPIEVVFDEVFGAFDLAEDILEDGALAVDMMLDGFGGHHLSLGGLA